MSAARGVSSVDNGTTSPAQQAIFREVTRHTDLLHQMAAEREEHKAAPLSSRHTVTYIDPVLRTLSPATGPQQYGLFCGSPPKDLETLADIRREDFPAACAVFGLYYLWKALKQGFNLEATSAERFNRRHCSKSICICKKDPS